MFIKMQTKSVDMDCAKKVFGWTGVASGASNFFTISRTGRQQPNIVIGLDGSELPMQDGDIIDPFRGFYMPKVVDLLPFEWSYQMSDIRIGFFMFVQSATAKTPFTGLHLGNPNRADCILITGLPREPHMLCNVVNLEKGSSSIFLTLGRSVYGQDSFVEICRQGLSFFRRSPSRYDKFYDYIAAGNGSNRVTEWTFDYMYYRLFSLCDIGLKKRAEIERCAKEYLR